jgi:hypothetical protein
LASSLSSSPLFSSRSSRLADGVNKRSHSSSSTLWSSTLLVFGFAFPAVTLSFLLNTVSEAMVFSEMIATTTRMAYNQQQLDLLMLHVADA